MRVRVLKPWTIEGCTYSNIGEELDVWDNHAIRGIRDGYCEDVDGRIKARMDRLAAMKRAEEETKETKIKKGKIENGYN